MLNWRLESKDNYYPNLKAWWEQHGFPVLTYDSLPIRIFVVYKVLPESYVDLYAVPVYMTDSSFCIIGFPTSNKEADKQYKEGALEYLLEKIETTMKYEGKGIIMTTSATGSLMEKFDSQGYQRAEEKVNYYTKNI